MNVLLQKSFAHASGSWLDIGGGDSPSYLRVMPSQVKRLATDIKGDGNVIEIDANGPLPFADHSFDGLIALNMLYILRDPYAVLCEFRRIVKPGGTLILSLPFFFPESPEPHDYHRWTREGAKQILGRAGWSDAQIQAVGGPGTVFGSSLYPLRGSVIARLMFAPFVLAWDYLARRNDVTSFWFVCAKKSEN